MGNGIIMEPEKKDPIPEKKKIVRIKRPKEKRIPKANGRPKKKVDSLGREMKRKRGQPTVMTPEVMSKLEQAWSIGATHIEACGYAGISYEALNKYMLKNPEYRQIIDALKDKPILKARQTIANNLSDPSTAKWYLEKKRRTEFGNQVDITSSDGSMAPTIQIEIIDGTEES